jgi:hypothetical protein
MMKAGRPGRRLLKESNSFFVDMPQTGAVDLTGIKDMYFTMRRFLATFFVFLLFLSLSPGYSYSREVTLSFADFPKDAAGLFRAKFPELQKEFKSLGNGSAQLFVYHDAANNEYKTTLIMQLTPATFGVYEHRVARTKLDLRPFAPYFLALDTYRNEVRKSSPDLDVRAFISRMLMSIMLIDTRGKFEFFGDTDFFMGVREAIISPNFVYEPVGKKPISIKMEPTAVVSQVFILPAARDEKRKPTEASLIYDFFSFEY